MENRKILQQKGLKLLKVLSTGDKTKRAETPLCTTDCVLSASIYCVF